MDDIEKDAILYLCIDFAIDWKSNLLVSFIKNIYIRNSCVNTFYTSTSFINGIFVLLQLVELANTFVCLKIVEMWMTFELSYLANSNAHLTNIFLFNYISWST